MGLFSKHKKSSSSRPAPGGRRDAGLGAPGGLGDVSGSNSFALALAAQGLGHDAMVFGPPPEPAPRRASRTERAEEERRPKRRKHRKHPRRHYPSARSEAEETPMLTQLLGDFSREEDSEDGDFAWAAPASSASGHRTDHSAEEVRGGGASDYIMDGDEIAYSFEDVFSEDEHREPTNVRAAQDDDLAVGVNDFVGASEHDAPETLYVRQDGEVAADDYDSFSESHSEDSDVQRLLGGLRNEVEVPSGETSFLEPYRMWADSSREEDDEIAPETLYVRQDGEVAADDYDSFSESHSEDSDVQRLLGGLRNEVEAPSGDTSFLERYRMQNGSDESSEEEDIFDLNLNLAADNSREEDDEIVPQPQSPKSYWQDPYTGKGKDGRYQDLASLGEHYRGEDKTAQWRIDDLGETGGKLGNVRTTHFNKAQRAGHRIQVGPDGSLMQRGKALDTSGSKGNRLDSGADSMIFAMAATGELQAADQFAENNALRKEEGEALKWIKSMEARGDATPTIEMVKARFGAHVDAKRYVHHSSFFGGTDLAGAGELSVQEGRLKRLNPNSGHHKPGLNQTTNVVNELSERGANLDDALVDVNRLDKDGKAMMNGRNTVNETFHAGEILAAQGDYHQLMNKKDLLGQIRTLHTGHRDEDDVAEEVNEIFHDKGEAAAIAHADRLGFTAGRGIGRDLWVERHAEIDTPKQLLARAKAGRR